MELGQDMEGVVGFELLLFRIPLSHFLLFQSDAGGAAASPISPLPPSPSHS